MIRQLLKLSPIQFFIIKCLTFIFLYLLACLTLIALINPTLELSFTNQHLIEELLLNIPRQHLYISILLIILLCLISYLFTYYQLRSLKNTIRKSLEEKKLHDYFEQLYQGKTFLEIRHNIEKVLNLYKNFDTMKSHRIHLETSTQKILMSHLNEGIIFVDEDKIVTHINALAEKQLKLIPGEIINQHLSRKIHYQTLLENLNDCIKEDKKSIDQEFDGEPSEFNYSIIPIKNVQKERVTRAIIIIKSKPPHQSS